MNKIDEYQLMALINNVKVSMSEAHESDCIYNWDEHNNDFNIAGYFG